MNRGALRLCRRLRATPACPALGRRKIEPGADVEQDCSRFPAPAERVPPARQSQLGRQFFEVFVRLGDAQIAEIRFGN